MSVLVLVGVLFINGGVGAFMQPSAGANQGPPATTQLITTQHNVDITTQHGVALKTDSP